MANTNPKVVSIFNDDGTAAQYTRVSARIPEFLMVYGPDKGFRVRSEIVDYLDVSEGRKTVLMGLIENRLLDADRIEEVLNDKKYVFRSKLLDKDGNIVAEATAVKRVWKEKDFETGETAALQRLLARVGFGGDVFDIDEINDMEDQKLTYQVGEPGDTSSAIDEPKVDANPQQAKPEAERETKTTEVKAPVEDKKPDAKQKSAPANDTSKQGQGKRAEVTKVQPAQLKMLESQARIKGVECPTVETIDQFQAELARIRALPLPE